MTARVVTTVRADQDIADAVAYYAGEGAHDAAFDLVDQLERAMRSLGAHPTLGSARLAVEIGIDEIRTLSLPRLPYVVIYTDDADAVRIHRVLHTSRDLGGVLRDG